MAECNDSSGVEETRTAGLMDALVDYKLRLGQDTARKDPPTQAVDSPVGIQGLMKILMGSVPSTRSQAAITSPTSNELNMHSILEPSEMQRLVDSIYEISVSLDNPVSHREFMIKIITDTGVIPSKWRLRDVVQISPHPEMMTEGANVSRAVHGGHSVAFKKSRHHSCPEGLVAPPSDIFGEFSIMSMLDHPHVLPVLGIFVDPRDSLPAMVSLYIYGGTITAYLERHPNADRLRLLAETASGIAYIHSLPYPVVHRDIRGSNVMVNAEGKAVIIDFGSSILLKSGGAAVSSLHDDSPGSTRWMAPEALLPGRYAVTQKADVWSFACLEIEVFTGKRPFDNIIRDGAVVIEVLVKHRCPKRPQNVPSARQLTDRVWALMEQSWKLDPAHRPSMAEVHSLIGSLSGMVNFA